MGEGVTAASMLLALDEAPDAVLCTDGDGRIVYANRAAGGLLGYSAEELLRLHYRDVAPNGTTFRGKDGALVSVDVSRGESAAGTCYIARPGASGREATAELAELGRLARHDLLEPLRAITTFSDLLREDLGASMPPAARRDLDFILSAAGRLERLLNGMAALLRASQTEMKWAPVELTACAEAALAAVKDQQARVRLDPLPRVTGDASLLKQLFQRLLDNALRHAGPAAHVHLHAERSGEEWIVRVSDDGPGIPADSAGQVFQPFRRAGSSDGAGAGLAVCRKIVLRHGGRIWLETPAGGGCAVCFTLGEWAGRPV